MRYYCECLVQEKQIEIAMNRPTDRSDPRSVIAAFLIAAAAIVVGAVLLLTTRPQTVQIVVNPPVPTATSAPSETPGPIQVYVTGAVLTPQSRLSLPHGSRVEDAVAAAGGLAAGADPDRINLAAVLRDGDQVHVFLREADAPADALATPSGGVVVNVNTADLDALVNLPGIGPAVAQDIIDYRAANGPFADLDALDAVPGIGPALLEEIAPLVVFD